jgi:hypothetical protein
MIAVLEAPAKCAECGKELSPGERARVYGARVYGEGCHAIPIPLDGNLWQEALKVANRFRYKADPEDRDDLVQNIILRCGEVARRRELTEASLWVIARYEVFRYWRERAKKPLSLNAPVLDTEETIELWETLEDKGADLDTWLEAKSRLGELPPGILLIAKKLERGDPLTGGQRARLARFRQDGRGPQAWSTKRYRRLRSKGLCATCGVETGDSVRCPRCRGKMRVAQARYRRRRGNWQRALRACWRKQGRCPRCGKPAARPAPAAWPRTGNSCGNGGPGDGSRPRGSPDPLGLAPDQIDETGPWAERWLSIPSRSPEASPWAF